MNSLGKMTIDAFNKLVDEYGILLDSNAKLYAALEEISEMRIESPADIHEVKSIARKAINECD